MDYYSIDIMTIIYIEIVENLFKIRSTFLSSYVLQKHFIRQTRKFFRIFYYYMVILVSIDRTRQDICNSYSLVW